MGIKKCDGWNSRYSDERFHGDQGCKGYNESPTEFQLEFPLDHGTANSDSALTYPNDMVLTGAKLVMTELFTGGTTLICGRVGHTDSLILNTDFDLPAGALTQWLALGTLAAPDRTWDTANPAVAEIIRATLVGGPLAGHGTLTLFFTK